MKGLFQAGLAFCLISIVTLSIAATASAQGDPWWLSKEQTSFIQIQENNNSMINWQKGEIVVMGEGIANPNRGWSMAQMEAMAERAARVDAQRNFVETTAGVIVTSLSKMINKQIDVDSVRSEARGIVNGLVTVKGPEMERRQDGSIIARVWMSQGMQSVRDLAFRRLQEERDNNKNSIRSYPDYPREKVKPTGTVYTGLIVDCRGVPRGPVRPSLTPRIIDEDQREIYGTLKVKKIWLLSYGLVGYEPSVEEAKKQETKRVGENPLVVKAMSVIGTNNDEVVLDNDAARKVVSADKASGFFNKAKVVFVLD